MKPEAVLTASRYCLRTYLNEACKAMISYDPCVVFQPEVEARPSLRRNVNEPHRSILKRGLRSFSIPGSKQMKIETNLPLVHSCPWRHAFLQRQEHNSTVQDRNQVIVACSDETHSEDKIGRKLLCSCTKLSRVGI